jgi:hypothetical protein
MPTGSFAVIADSDQFALREACIACPATFSSMIGKADRDIRDFPFSSGSTG